MAAQEYEREEAAEAEQPAENTEVKALEFELDDSVYCVDIGYIAEIVNCGELTELPGSGAHIDGVVALRDEAVKVVNLKTLLGIETPYADEKLIVFKRREDADSRLGWLVDGVRGVTTFSRSDVEAASSEPGVEGVIQREESFVIWLDPAEVRI